MYVHTEIWTGCTHDGLESCWGLTEKFTLTTLFGDADVSDDAPTFNITTSPEPMTSGWLQRTNRKVQNIPLMAFPEEEWIFYIHPSRIMFQKNFKKHISHISAAPTQLCCQPISLNWCCNNSRRLHSRIRTHFYSLMVCYHREITRRNYDLFVFFLEQNLQSPIVKASVPRL